MSTEKIELQKKILEIFIEVKKICEKHNIRYFATGGTCIGAVRHKGFIPWDDDLDISVPINDFYRLRELCEKELPEPYKVFMCTEHRHNPNPFMKVHNTQTTFIEKFELDYPEDYKGVFIDIFPLAGVPSEKKERKSYYRKLILLIALNNKWHYKLFECPGKKGMLLWLLTCPLRPFLPFTYWSDKLYEFYNKFDFDSCEYTGNTWDANIAWQTFPREWFDGFSELPFEDSTIRCPKNWDAYLTAHFGDYMKLPPENERQSHDIGGIVDLEKPFSYYAEEYRKRS